MEWHEHFAALFRADQIAKGYEVAARKGREHHVSGTQQDALSADHDPSVLRRAMQRLHEEPVKGSYGCSPRRACRDAGDRDRRDCASHIRAFCFEESQKRGDHIGSSQSRHQALQEYSHKKWNCRTHEVRDRGNVSDRTTRVHGDEAQSSASWFAAYGATWLFLLGLGPTDEIPR